MTQRLLYIMLSLSELTISVGEMTSWIIYDTHETFVYYIEILITFFAYTLMYEIMIALTVDRFLKIFLNIKYPLYWSYSRTVKLVIAFFFLNGMMCVCFWLTNSVDNLYTYYFLPFDLLFLTVATCTYAYICIKIHKNRRAQHLQFPQKQLDSKHPTSSTTTKEKTMISKQNKQFLSTFLLVMTFSCFNVVPDLCYFLLDHKGWQNWIHVVCTFLYCISYICDFFIYTFSSKPIRRKLMKWVQCFRPRLNNTLN